jgi:hypothetical protein
MGSVKCCVNSIELGTLVRISIRFWVSLVSAPSSQATSSAETLTTDNVFFERSKVFAPSTVTFQLWSRPTSCYSINSDSVLSLLSL